MEEASPQREVEKGGRYDYCAVNARATIMILFLCSEDLVYF